MSHMPFGFGPRSCIGMRLALLQAKIAIIELLKRYTFNRAPETEVSWRTEQILTLETIKHFCVAVIVVYYNYFQVPVKPGVGIVMRPKNGIYLKVTNRL